jgi:DNA replication protein DnaC
MNTQQTLEKMRNLRLHGMQLAYTSSMESQSRLQLTADALFSMLIDAEWQDCSNKKVARLTVGAAFRYQSHLSEIKYQAARDLDKELLNRLASCQFIQQKENIFITGPLV